MHIRRNRPVSELVTKICQMQPGQTERSTDRIPDLKITLRSHRTGGICDRLKICAFLISVPFTRNHLNRTNI